MYEIRPRDVEALRRTYYSLTGNHLCSERGVDGCWEFSDLRCGVNGAAFRLRKALKEYRDLIPAPIEVSSYVTMNDGVSGKVEGGGFGRPTRKRRFNL